MPPFRKGVSHERVTGDSPLFQTHNNTAHFTSIVPRFGELTEKPSDVNLYKIL